MWLQLPGIWICQSATKRLGKMITALLSGMSLSVLITRDCSPKGLLWLLAGFLDFLYLDIIKPWPICWLGRQVLAVWASWLTMLAGCIWISGDEG